MTHPKVQELSETWGYTKAGEQQPFADSPVYAVVLKKLPV
ncbi:acetyltransferase [Streptomyces sp. NPDC001822]